MADAAAIKERLLAGVEGLARSLGLAEPNRRLSSSRELRFGRRGSLAVWRDGPKRGVFSDFEAGRSGDLIALVAHRLGLSNREAFHWAAEWCGLAGEDVAEPRASKRTLAPVSYVKANARDARSGGERRAAWKIWNKRQAPEGTVVKTYLLSRGIRLLPKSLGFIPALDYRGCDAGGREVRLSFPAMVAAVQGLDGRFIGVHRTYLAADGGGKAPVAAPRKIRGQYWGGAIRLAEASGPRLALAEGIETGLSVLQAFEGRLPVWAVIAAGNFAACGIPDNIKEVVFLGDGDEPGLAESIAAGVRPVTPAGRALARAAWLRLSRGYRVRVAVPEMRGAGKVDWNDVLLREAA